MCVCPPLRSEAGGATDTGVRWGSSEPHAAPYAAHHRPHASLPGGEFRGTPGATPTTLGATPTTLGDTPTTPGATPTTLGATPTTPGATPTTLGGTCRIHHATPSPLGQDMREMGPGLGKGGAVVCGREPFVVAEVTTTPSPV